MRVAGMAEESMRDEGQKRRRGQQQMRGGGRAIGMLVAEIQERRADSRPGKELLEVSRTMFRISIGRVIIGRRNQ